MAFPFHVKICGITRIEDAFAVQGAGGDAIGLNFYSQSKRYIDVEDAAALVSEFRGQSTREKHNACAYQVPKVFGVFVNASPEEILEIHQRVELDGIQLHGDEPPELLPHLKRELADFGRPPVLKAIHVQNHETTADFSDAIQLIQEWASHGIDGVLLDAVAPGEYGGTGITIDWNAVVSIRRELKIPITLAGGLTPDNVSEAIRLTKVSSVDVASGVETKPGIKDRDLVAVFVGKCALTMAENGS